MSDEQLIKIREVMEEATKLVNSWPEWKRHILEHSSRPTLSEPRKPVCDETINYF